MKTTRTYPEKYAARHRQICERAEREFTESRAKDSDVVRAIEIYSQKIMEYARCGDELAGILATASAHLARLHFLERVQSLA